MRAPAPRNLRPTLPQRAGLACFSSMLAMVKDNAHMIDVHQVSTVVEQSNEVGDQERRGFIQELLSQVGMLRVAWGGAGSTPILGRPWPFISGPMGDACVSLCGCFA